jgi:hypothetical protein
LGYVVHYALVANNVTSGMRGEVKTRLIGRTHNMFLGFDDVTHNVWQLAEVPIWSPCTHG